MALGSITRRFMSKLSSELLSLFPRYCSNSKKSKGISMKILVILTIAIILSLVGISLNIFKGQQAKGQESHASKLARLKDEKLPLEDRIGTAKEIGVNELRLALPIVEYEYVENVDDAIKRSDVITAQPIESFSKHVSGTKIITWYKFRILERIARRTIPPCCDIPATIPQELLPLGENELLVPIVGGKLVIEGMTVNQSSHLTEYFSSETKTEQIPHPTALHHRIAGNKTYLIFIKPQPSRQFVMLHFGPAGVFEVSSDDNLVPSLNRNNRHPLVRSIMELGVDGNELSLHKQKSKLELFRTLVQQRNGR